MIAADTNVVLRLILENDDAQLGSVRTLLTKQRLFLPLTVLLEVGWVLASRYQMSRAHLSSALDALLQLEGVEIARAQQVQWAVDRFRAGADWADMIHLVASRKLDGFATFDQRLGRLAGGETPVRVDVVR